MSASSRYAITSWPCLFPNFSLQICGINSYISKLTVTTCIYKSDSVQVSLTLCTLGTIVIEIARKHHIACLWIKFPAIRLADIMRRKNVAWYTKGNTNTLRPKRTHIHCHSPWKSYVLLRKSITVIFTARQYWFEQWFGTIWTTIQYLNQRWRTSQTHSMRHWGNVFS